MFARLIYFGKFWLSGADSALGRNAVEKELQHPWHALGAFTKVTTAAEEDEVEEGGRRGSGWRHGWECMSCRH